MLPISSRNRSAAGAVVPTAIVVRVSRKPASLTRIS
jgi:hypothetical protein